MRSKGRESWVFETAEAPSGDGSISILDAFGEKGAGLFPC